MGCSRAAVVLATAAVHWRQGRWAEAGAVLEAAAEFCSSRLAWRVSIAHALLMQGAPCNGHLSCAPNLSPHGCCPVATCACPALRRESGRGRPGMVHLKVPR